MPWWDKKGELSLDPRVETLVIFIITQARLTLYEY